MFFIPIPEDPIRLLYPLSRACLGVVAVLLLASCQDESPPTPLTAPEESSYEQAPAYSRASAVRLRDRDIDPGDTHFAVDVTTRRTITGSGQLSTSSGEIGTAAVTPATTISPVRRSFEKSRIETGYGGSGELRFSVYPERTTDTRAGTAPSLIRSIGNQVTVYDRSGRIVTSKTFGSFMARAGLPGGTLQGSTIEGGLYARDPALRASGTDVRTMGAQPQVERIGSDLLQVTTHIAPSGIAGVGALATEARDAGTTVVRRYRMRGEDNSPSGGEIGATTSESKQKLGKDGGKQGVWLLEGLEQTTRQWTPAGEVQVHVETEYAYRQWNVNPAEDRKRREERETLGPMAVEPIRPPPGENSPPPPPPPPPPPDEDPGSEFCGRGASKYVRTVVSGGPPVVYQHGICSEANTWNGMRPSVAQAFGVGVEQAYSLESNSRLEVQTTDLINKLSARGVKGNIVVSHSQGALIAARGPQYVANGIRNEIGRYCYGNFLCLALSKILADVTTDEIVYGLLPVVRDDRPGSAFLGQLNGTYERFRRASIENDAGPRWSLFRLVGDYRSPRTDLLYNNAPDGRNSVEAAQSAYLGGWFLQYLAQAIIWSVSPYGSGYGCYNSGYDVYWPPCYDPYGYDRYWRGTGFWYDLANILYFLGSNITSTLDSIDQFWAYAVAGGYYPMDGFIQFSSQIYPRSPGAYAPRRYPIYGSDSHTGETASPLVLRELTRELRLLGVPIRP